MPGPRNRCRHRSWQHPSATWHGTGHHGAGPQVVRAPGFCSRNGLQALEQWAAQRGARPEQRSARGPGTLQSAGVLRRSTCLSYLCLDFRVSPDLQTQSPQVATKHHWSTSAQAKLRLTTTRDRKTQYQSTTHFFNSSLPPGLWVRPSAQTSTGKSCSVCQMRSLW